MTPLEQEILEFERGRWRFAGAKETAIRQRWELSPTRYAQIVNALLDDPAAYAADPVLIKRLRRLRDHRRTQRAG